MPSQVIRDESGAASHRRSAMRKPESPVGKAVGENGDQGAVKSLSRSRASVPVVEAGSGLEEAANPGEEI